MRAPFRVAAAAATCGLAAVIAAGVTGTRHAAASSSGTGHVLGDFNGDGYADLAVAAPGANGGAGAVYVLYGSASGPSMLGSQIWTLSTPGINGVPAAGDALGTGLAIGDFNHDGYADLAIGIPGKNHVLVLYGAARGLQAAGNQYFHANGPLGGSALAAGDFNGDGCADLAVGEPFAKAVKTPAAGSVEVHYGSSAGLTALDAGTAQMINEATPGLPGNAPQSNDNFGLSLAAGDFNGDGLDDLAVGAPNGDFSHGAVTALYGSSAGITTTGSQFIATFGDGGGFAQAAGDFNGDGIADLVIGAPNTATSSGDAGNIEIHYGSTAGLTKTRPGTAKVIAEVNLGMVAHPTAPNDFFGYSLAAGDFNGDGADDIAVGVPGKSAAIVLHGGANGIVASGARYAAGVGPQSTAQLGKYGVSVAAADFNHDGFDDLVFGEPFTDVASASAAGVVELHSGSSTGVTHTGMGKAPLISEGTAGMPGTGPATDDNFGFAAATGRASS